MIRIENIGKVFNPHSRNRNEVLKGVTFELPEKGLVCIYGKSGSGKTTLLNIIGGLDKQDRGNLAVDGETVKGNRDNIRNRKIGFIFQNYYLESGYTISQIMRNAMLIAGFKDEKEIAERSKTVLELVDMWRFKNKQGDALSGGQKQRVAIARALIKGSEIILADEPTGNLDADNTMKVMDILKEISKTRLVVVVTHEVTLIKKYADSYIQLVDGQLTDKDVIGEVFRYETEKNNIYIDEENSREVSDGNVNLKVYGDPSIKSEDIRIISDKGKIFIETGKNVTVLNKNSEKKVVFRGCEDEGEKEEIHAVPKFTQCENKRNGRLFNLKNIFKSKKNLDGEKLYSTANIFKQVFICVIAVVMCFFSMAGFEILRGGIDNKKLDENSVFVNINAYYDVKQLPRELYTNIDFFETKYREGDFSYNGLTALSGIKVNYTPCAIERDMTEEDFDLSFGKMPGENQVLITRALADKLQKEFRIEELKNDVAMPLVLFENKYSVSGIVEEDSPKVYMHKSDYINFLGVFNAIKFLDPSNIFFEEDFIRNTYSSEIIVAEEGDLKDVNEVKIEINRNSLYKMMKNTIEADYRIKSANSKLMGTVGRTGVEIAESNLYVKKFSVTRDVMKTDLKIYVHEDALDNIFVYMAPTFNSYGDKKTENGRSLGNYFEIKTEGGEQLTSLVERLENIPKINIEAKYLEEEQEALDESLSGLTVFFVISVLLLTVYFFIEKSGSIKNAKEYGIYRAIGVNRSNLLFKESVLAFFDNIISYSAFYLLTSVLLVIRYAIMNVSLMPFVGILFGVYALSTVILMAISLVPYLFVLHETPSQILSKYDI